MEEYTYCPYCDEEVEVIDHGTGIQKKVCPECDEVSQSRSLGHMTHLY